MKCEHEAAEAPRKLKPRHIRLLLDNSDRFSILDSPQTVSMQSGLVTLMPGENVGEHSTGAHEETIVFLEGHGEVRTDGIAHQQVEYGHVMYVPPQTLHNVFNTGDVPLKYIYVVARIP